LGSESPWHSLANGKPHPASLGDGGAKNNPHSGFSFSGNTQRLTATPQIAANAPEGSDQNFCFPNFRFPTALKEAIETARGQK
jgi:hypothetical protein